MFQKLQLRLTLLCATVTGLILITLSLICLAFSERGMWEQEDSSFQTNLTTMYQNLRDQTVLSHSWIRQMEHQYHFYLRMRSNGKTLFFQRLEASSSSGPSDDPVEKLLDSLERTAAAEYRIDAAVSVAPKSYILHREFPFRDMRGNPAAASVALIPRYGQTLSVSVLHPQTELLARVQKQRILFLAADLAAFLLLGIFFWFFTARMLRPLKENRRRQIQFVASASHELRAPLTVMLSNIDAVRQQSIPADSQFLNTLASEGQRMSRLINDMLQLASADNHTWAIHPVPAEIDTLLLSIWEAYETQANEQNLRWEIRLPEEAVPRCVCDPERIRQLLAILIDNAFSYTPAGGRILLSLSASPSALRVTVSDNGPGIPDEQKSAVFERFCCLDPSHKNKAHFGLGLCIAQEIVKLHKGEITLSDTPGGGATFRVTLPLGSLYVS